MIPTVTVLECCFPGAKMERRICSIRKIYISPKIFNVWGVLNCSIYSFGKQAGLGAYEGL